MSDQEVRLWAGLIKRYPEAGLAGIIVTVVTGLAINFGWWLIALPDLINAHSDSRLIAAFFGSFGLVLLDAVLVVRAMRWANRIHDAIETTENTHDDEN